jgi:hypothetical protein
VNFEAAVLERDGAEVVRAISAQLFGKKHNMGFVNRPKVSGEVVEIAKGFEEVVFNQIPVFLVEGRTETIRARAGVVVHGEKSIPNLIRGEGANQGGSMGGVKRSGGNKWA